MGPGQPAGSGVGRLALQPWGVFQRSLVEFGLGGLVFCQVSWKSFCFGNLKRTKMAVLFCGSHYLSSLCWARRQSSWYILGSMSTFYKASYKASCWVIDEAPSILVHVWSNWASWRLRKDFQGVFIKGYKNMLDTNFYGPQTPVPQQFIYPSLGLFNSLHLRNLPQQTQIPITSPNPTSDPCSYSSNLL